MTDADISGALGVGHSTVEQLRRRQKRLDGEGEARLIAIAWVEPPDGRAKWTLKLLADRLVEWEIVETISTETVRRVLKKTN